MPPLEHSKLKQNIITSRGFLTQILHLQGFQGKKLKEMGRRLTESHHLSFKNKFHNERKFTFASLGVISTPNQKKEFFFLKKENSAVQRKFGKLAKLKKYPMHSADIFFFLSKQCRGFIIRNNSLVVVL